MDVKDMNPNQFQDIFGTGGNTGGGNAAPTFGMEQTNLDMFDNNPEASNPETKITDTSLPEEVKDVLQNQETEVKDTDILNIDENKDENKEESEATATANIGLSEYFKAGIEKGIFSPIQVENEAGETVDFVPQTPEEFDEAIELQLNYKLEQKAKEVEQAFYADKSPAWKAVFQYAQMVDSPEELKPFLEGVQSITSIASLNENEIDGAEAIVRFQLESAGVAKKIVDKQIEALKTTNSLVEAATEAKPELLKAETQRLQQMKQEEARKLEDYRNMVIDIRNNAIQAIETPIGSTPLKNEEKAAIYELIAAPSPETQGYPIYNKIDELFEKKDFETLKQVALFLTHKDSFINYIASEAKHKNAEGLQRKMRIAGEKSTGGKDVDVSTKPIIKRQAPNTPAKGGGFGRY